MRVLHFYKTYYPETMGGTEQVIHQLACSARSLDVETEVLSLSLEKNPPATIQLNGHQVHRVPMNFQIASTRFSTQVFQAFKSLVQKADVIHYHYPWPFMDLVHFATRVKKPTVLTYHADIVRQKRLLPFYRPLQQQFLKSVDQIVATSPNYIETSPVLTQFKHKTTVIPIGLNASTYPVVSPLLTQQWRQRIGERFFLFIGMLRYYKGLHTLLDSMVDAPFPVVIIGRGQLELELKQRAQQLGLKNIHFVGPLPDEDKVALLNLCHGIVFPSHLRSEAFGISLLEGAMFAKPLISCEIGTGTSYINQNQVTGLVIPPNDPNALRQAMLTLWQDPDLAHQMGQQAYQRYLSLFTADKMAAMYTKLYHQILKVGVRG